MGFSVLGFSVPVFVIGYLADLPVRHQAQLAAGAGLSAHRATGFGGFLQRLILPSLTLSVIYIALIARMTRTSVLEVMGEDYIRTARAKGQVERKVLFRHALTNAAVPIVTVIGLGIALLIGGVVVTESVFTIPGLGRLTVDAVLARDYPTIQAVILLFSLVYVLINLAVDLDLHAVRSEDPLLSVETRPADRRRRPLPPSQRRPGRPARPRRQHHRSARHHAAHGRHRARGAVARHHEPVRDQSGLPQPRARHRADDPPRRRHDAHVHATAWAPTASAATSTAA